MRTRHNSYNFRSTRTPALDRASARCSEETFLVDDDTVIAGVIGTGMLPADRAKKVIDTCPTKAISIVEGGGSAAEE